MSRKRTGKINNWPPYIYFKIFQYIQVKCHHCITVLTVIQNFLDWCQKRRFISFPVSIEDLLNKQDRNILKKLISTDCHPLKDIIPVQKTYVHNLWTKGCARPKINTQRFMNSFVNRLIFKLHLLWWHTFLIYMLHKKRSL